MTVPSPVWASQGLLYSPIQEIRPTTSTVPDAAILGFRSIALRAADLASPALLGEHFSTQQAWQTYQLRDFEALWQLYAGLPAGSVAAMTPRDQTLGLLAGLRCRHVPVADVLQMMLHPTGMPAWEALFDTLFDPEANAAAGWTTVDWQERLRSLYKSLNALSRDSAWQHRARDLGLLVERLLLRTAHYLETALGLRDEALQCLDRIARRQQQRSPSQPDHRLMAAIARLKAAPAPDEMAPIRKLQAEIDHLQRQRQDMQAEIDSLQAEIEPDQEASPPATVSQAMAELRAQVERLTQTVADLDRRAEQQQAELAQRPEAAVVVEADRQQADRLLQIEAAQAGFADDWRRVATFFEPGSGAEIPNDLPTFPFEARQAFGGWQDFHKLESGWTLRDFADPAKSFTAWRCVLESLLERILVQPFMAQADPTLFEDVSGQCPLTARYRQPLTNTIGLGKMKSILKHAGKTKNQRQQAFVDFLTSRPGLTACLEADFILAFQGLIDFNLNGLAHKPAKALAVYPTLYPLCMRDLFGDFDRSRFSLVGTLLKAHEEGLARVG